ncbi:MAG: LacI family DNA-binding transcriptional regulator [Eubacteriales bacterium]|nr:LacI family DNA-binding transcriptional regulator [Eubacteriales bacterium]
MKNSNVSIFTIAEKAGISTATVSRVLNHPELVNSKTVELVRSTMKELDYVPRRSSAQKNKSTSKLLLVNVFQISNPFYSEVIRGIEASASNHNYRTLISQETLSTDEEIRSFMSFAKSLHISGVILCSPLSRPEQYHQIGDSIPLVQCCEYLSEDHSYVSINDYKAAFSAMEHIYSQGRRKIAFINGPTTYKYSKERQRGYDSFIHQAGLSAYPGWCVSLAEINYDMAYASACQMLTSGNPPDAIFASSDLIAAAVIKAAQQYRLNVPEDLVVVGFDNIDISTISSPSITTVSQPRFQIGYTAGEILNEHMTSSVAHTQHILHNTELIIRQSSAPQNTAQLGSGAFFSMPLLMETGAKTPL